MRNSSEPVSPAAPVPPTAPLPSNSSVPTANKADAVDKAQSAPRWKPILAIVVVIVSFVGATIIGQAVVLIYALLHGWSQSRSDQWLQNSVWAQFAFVVLAYGILLTAVGLATQGAGIRRSDIGLRKPRWSDLGKALLALPVYYFAYMILVAIARALVPSLNVNQKQQVGFSAAHGFVPLFVTFLSLAIIPPVVEEIVMRGYLYSNLRAKWPLVTATLVTSVLFAIGHLQFGSGAPLLWIAALDTFTLSLFLIYLRQSTNSIWPSILLHGLKNTIAFLALFVFTTSFS